MNPDKKRYQIDFYFAQRSGYQPVTSLKSDTKPIIFFKMVRLRRPLRG